MNKLIDTIKSRIVMWLYPSMAIAIFIAEPAEGDSLTVGNMMAVFHRQGDEENV